MAFCPQCRAEINTMATKCPSCGFDFSEWDATPKATASGYLFARPIVGYLSLAGVLAAALVLLMMVKAPGLSVVLVANAVFCLIVFSTLASLVRTGQVRCMAAGFTVGAVLYLIVVRFFFPSENEIVPNEGDVNGVMVTTQLLQFFFRVTAANGEVVPKSDYIAFMWTGQAFWSIVIGLSCTLVVRRLYVKLASSTRTATSDTEQSNG